MPPEGEGSSQSPDQGGRQGPEQQRADIDPQNRPEQSGGDPRGRRVYDPTLAELDAIKQKSQIDAITAATNWLRSYAKPEQRKELLDAYGGDERLLLSHKSVMEDVLRARPIEQEDVGRVRYETPPAAREEGLPGRVGWERISIRSAYSPTGYRDVEVPQSDEGKRYWIREILARVEAVPESEGGAVDRVAFEEAALVVSAVIEHPERFVHDAQDKVGFADKLKKEFYARIHWHGVVQSYNKVGSVDDLVSAISPIKADEINLLMSANGYDDEDQERKNIRKAFVLYDAVADEWICGSPERRKQLDDWVASQTTPTTPQGIEGLKPMDRYWAQRLGFNIWRVGARLFVQERLIGEGQRTNVAESNKKILDIDYRMGRAASADFAGGSVYGIDYSVRRIINMSRFTRRSFAAIRPYMWVYKDWNMGSKDVFSRLVNDSTDRLIDKLKYEAESGGRTLSAKELDDLKDRARQTVGGWFRNRQGKSLYDAVLEQTRDKRGNLHPEKLKDSWPPRLANWEYDVDKGEVETYHFADHLQNVDWSKIDFAAMGEKPFMEYGLYELSYADNARKLLVSPDGNGFVQKPWEYEQLKKLKEPIVSFQGPGGHKSMAALTWHRIEYLKKYLKIDSSLLDKEIKAANDDKIIDDVTAIKFRSDMFVPELFKGWVKNLSEASEQNRDKKLLSAVYANLANMVIEISRWFGVSGPQKSFKKGIVDALAALFKAMIPIKS